ncbi:hypothetical protein ACJJIF_12010 [Microbulbifer sp. SSSA002]
MDQIDFYKTKLNYETDSWDLGEAINNRESVIVIDARAESSYEDEHILQQ